jgi:transketolase
MALTKSEEIKIQLEILDIKKDVLKMIHMAQSGHPGGSLSCVDLLYLLYSQIMKIDPINPVWEDRDIFILSKGHAAPALYAVLSRFGFINRNNLFSLRKFGSELQGHPVKNQQMGIEITTGSLGMGLSIGIGSALSAKLDKKLGKYIYVLLGDGELNEGPIWEAIMAASHYKLDNLIAIVDRNGIQLDGATEEIMTLEPLAEKWRAFGWEVIEVDGSNVGELLAAFKKAKTLIKKPKVIISYLIKGADVSFMEHTKTYHGRPPSDQEYLQAIKEIEKLKNKIRS